MNKHILFLIDHLVNTGKYTQAELDANKEYTYTSDAAAYRAAAYRADYYSCRADRFTAVFRAASYWVAEYFKSTGEDKQTYIDKLGE
jgi:hypothetical protein